MTKKYISPITATLTLDNWQGKINLADMNLDDTMDLLGDLKAMEAFGKKVGGFLKEAVKAKMPEGDTEYYGNNFCVVLSERYRAGGLDKEKITKEMGEEWVEDHSKEGTEYTELRLKSWSPEE